MYHRHTETPWTVKYTTNVMAPDGTCLATCGGRCSNREPQASLLEAENAANARLISAAPDLLAACEKAIDALEDAVDNASDPQAMEDWQNARHGAIKALNDAIVKATS